MTQTISRIYQVRENADAAATELKKAGFADHAIDMLAPAEAPDEQILARIRRSGVMATHAEVFAEGIKRGETLVSVQAQFGCAALATAILQKHSPTDTGLAEQGSEKAPPDPAAPLSSACGWKVLIDNPAPLSSSLGWSVLSARRPSRKPDSEFVDNPAPFSKAIHTPVLTNRSTILSSRVGWRVLLDNPAPLSGRVGWPILSKEQKLPPARFGLRLLSDNPAPLSARLGWKMLSNDPAPLSRFFGMRVLSNDAQK